MVGAAKSAPLAPPQEAAEHRVEDPVHEPDDDEQGDDVDAPADERRDQEFVAPSPHGSSIYSCATVFLASLASMALVAACPSNVANDLRPQPAGSQLITVEAASTKTTYATLRTWRRSGGCWVAVGGPYPARVGHNGIRKNRREGDGTTPIGTFRIGRVMYGNEPNPGVKFRYQRLRCGDWWNEDPSSPTYNTLQRLRCGQRPPFTIRSPGM